jgi:type II secretory pathway pseudopilin PulG
VEIPTRTQFARSKSFTLIETMIGTALGLAALTTAIEAFPSTDTGVHVLAQTTRLHDLRFAIGGAFASNSSFAALAKPGTLNVPDGSGSTTTNTWAPSLSLHTQPKHLLTVGKRSAPRSPAEFADSSLTSNFKQAGPTSPSKVST